MDSLDIRGYVPIFWHLGSMTSSLASGWFSGYLSSSCFSVRESRKSQGPFPMFFIRRWSLPWACLFTECFTSSCALPKENSWKEKRIWIEMRFCSYFTHIPSALGHKLTFHHYEDIVRVSAYKEKRVTLAHKFRGAKPCSTGLCCFGSVVRLYFMAQALGRVSEHLAWWVREWWERGKWPGSPNSSQRYNSIVFKFS